MKLLIAAAALAMSFAAMPAQAQTALDHRVQRAWDNTFDPPPRGDPRTNYERRRDAAYARSRRVDVRCRTRPYAASCNRAYRRY